MTKTIPHGTMNGYNHYGCRCADCKVAWAAYYRAYHRKRRAARRRVVTDG